MASPSFDKPARIQDYRACHFKNRGGFLLGCAPISKSGAFLESQRVIPQPVPPEPNKLRFCPNSDRCGPVANRLILIKFRHNIEVVR